MMIRKDLIGLRLVLASDQQSVLLQEEITNEDRHEKKSKFGTENNEDYIDGSKKK